MAYDEYTAERITRVLEDRKASFEARKMMGGMIFMVDEKMACGTHYAKKRETDLLMARVGEEAYPTLIQKEHAMPMDFTGRPMKGYVFITPEGYDADEDLEFWIDQVLAYNPFAKASKKRK